MDTPRKGSIIHHDLSVPEDFTFRHILYCCYALQEWEWITQPADGPYKQGYFYNKIKNVLSGLSHTSRKTALRHQHSSTCIVCEEPVDLMRSTLDHIMPIARGGPEDLGNALVLCKSHNSSKGTKDLLDWWMQKDYSVETLNKDVLILYARTHWQHAAPEWLRSPSTVGQRQFVAARAQMLPTPSHHESLYGSTYAGCGLSSWLIGHAGHD